MEPKAKKSSHDYEAHLTSLSLLLYKVELKLVGPNIRTRLEGLSKIMQHFMPYIIRNRGEGCGEVEHGTVPVAGFVLVVCPVQVQDSIEWWSVG